MSVVEQAVVKKFSNVTQRIEAELDKVEAASNGGVDTNAASGCCGDGGSIVVVEKIREIIKEAIDDFREELFSESFKFKMEIFKEFMTLRDDMRTQMEQHSINSDLLDEINRLREENKQLKKLF